LAEPLIAVAHLETERLEGGRDAVRRNTLFREVYREMRYRLFDRNTQVADLVPVYDWRSGTHPP
jgi:hypothetical protein